MAARLPIYLDCAATTPVDPRVVDAMVPWLGGRFGNPASRGHAWGREADDAVEKARAQVAELVGADAREIVWTSGATESDNLALKGTAHFHQARGRHIVTVKTEHKAVLDTVRELERRGFDATYLDVLPNGLLDLDAFEAALRPDTILASVMLVNNEIGVIQDIAAIGAICRERGIVFHVDAAQATGKVAIDLARLPVDLMSLTAHKTCGPKGIGALYVRRKPRVRIDAQMHGGGHERGMRSGTLPTHQCVGMGEAFRIAREEMDAEVGRMRVLHRKLLGGLGGLEQVFVNGDLERRVPHNLNLSVAFVDGEALTSDLGEIAVSSGSACASASAEPSHVLSALGRSDELARSSLRITIGRFTTEAEVDHALALVRERIGRLRALSPLWQTWREGIDPQAIDAGSFDQGDPTVGTGMVGAPARGGVMKLQIKVEPATGLIADARSKTYGCGAAIASNALASEWVRGKSLDQALAIRNTAIAAELALPPAKIHCSILAEDAIKAAVEDYRARHGHAAGADPATRS